MTCASDTGNVSERQHKKENEKLKTMANERKDDFIRIAKKQEHISSLEFCVRLIFFFCFYIVY